MNKKANPYYLGTITALLLFFAHVEYKFQMEEVSATKPQIEKQAHKLEVEQNRYIINNK